MKYFWVPSATHVLKVPLTVDGEEIQLTHYSRSYYVAASTADEALQLLRASVVAEQASLLEVEGMEEVSVSRVPGRMGKPLNRRARGVVWSSGRVFFPTV